MALRHCQTEEPPGLFMILRATFAREMHGAKTVLRRARQFLSKPVRIALCNCLAKQPSSLCKVLWSTFATSVHGCENVLSQLNTLHRC